MNKIRYKLRNSWLIFLEKQFYSILLEVLTNNCSLVLNCDHFNSWKNTYDCTSPLSLLIRVLQDFSVKVIKLVCSRQIALVAAFINFLSSKTWIYPCLTNYDRAYLFFFSSWISTNAWEARKNRRKRDGINSIFYFAYFIASAATCWI